MTSRLHAHPPLPHCPPKDLPATGRHL